MWENKKFIFCILIVSNFSDSDAFAKTVKDIVVGKVIIHPFAQDQLDADFSHLRQFRVIL
ncbi:hypothetical protein NBRC3299_2610 [Acetobacter pasteurianus NBRC 3299]|nr:hypothetical protein NBRC3299_2610 [Acetobacter pasteurianus NBRC 3299]